MTTNGTDFWRHCAHCGAELGLEDWPPVVDLLAGGGETDLYSFCDGACKAAWNGEP